MKLGLEEYRVTIDGPWAVVVEDIRSKALYSFFSSDGGETYRLVLRPGNPPYPSFPDHSIEVWREDGVLRFVDVGEKD